MTIEQNQQDILKMEQTTNSDFISGVRTGVANSNRKVMEITDDGVYFLQSIYMPQDDTYSDFLFYSDHDSDTVIALCGRPDCEHMVRECNAFFGGPMTSLGYFNGYLFVATPVYGTSLFELYRVSLDGTNRLKILDGSDINQGQYFGCMYFLIANGVFLAGLLSVDESGQVIPSWYYFLLDGSMEKPRITTYPFDHTDGMTFLVTVFEDNTKELLCKWNPEDNTVIGLFDKSDYSYQEYGYRYWASDAMYCMKENNVLRIDYQTGDRETLFSVDLQGVYSPDFYPDFVTFSGYNKITNCDEILFYSWDGKYLGILIPEFSYDRISTVIGGETKERILLTLGPNALPKYYIEKSDFESGKIELHTYQYPDLSKSIYNMLWNN